MNHPDNVCEHPCDPVCDPVREPVCDPVNEQSPDNVCEQPCAPDPASTPRPLRNPVQPSLLQCLAQIKASQDSLRAERTRLRRLAHQAQALLSSLPELDTSTPDGAYQPRTEIMLDASYAFRPSVSIRLFHLRSFKDERLCELLEAFLDAGWDAAGTYTDASFDTSIMRVFTFSFADAARRRSTDRSEPVPLAMPLSGGRTHAPKSGALPLTVQILACVKVQEGTCHRVQVGENRREVVTPVYEVVCA